MSLREHVPSGYRRRVTRSDSWLAYEGVFPRRKHRFCGKQDGETNHSERSFGTLRARVSRLVRRAYSFSKRVDRHLDAIHLFLTGHNLRIKQASSLKHYHKVGAAVPLARRSFLSVKRPRFHGAAAFIFMSAGPATRRKFGS